MLCKEQGITVTGICAIYEIFVAQKVNILFFIFLSLSLSPLVASKPPPASDPAALCCKYWNALHCIFLFCCCYNTYRSAAQNSGECFVNLVEYPSTGAATTTVVHFRRQMGSSSSGIRSRRRRRSSGRAKQDILFHIHGAHTSADWTFITMKPETWKRHLPSLLLLPLLLIRSG